MESLRDSPHLDRTGLLLFKGHHLLKLEKYTKNGSSSTQSEVLKLRDGATINLGIVLCHTFQSNAFFFPEASLLLFQYVRFFTCKKNNFYWYFIFLHILAGTVGRETQQCFENSHVPGSKHIYVHARCRGCLQSHHLECRLQGNRVLRKTASILA